jgi:chromosome segregation ATPase
MVEQLDQKDQQLAEQTKQLEEQTREIQEQKKMIEEKDEQLVQANQQVNDMLVRVAQSEPVYEGWIAKADISDEGENAQSEVTSLREKVGRLESMIDQVGVDLDLPLV